MVIGDGIQTQLLQLLARNSVQTPAPGADQRTAAALQLNPGQQVKAEILSTLSNHLYLARVAGELFKLEIPLVVRPGQSVPLTLVAVQPRVVFELRRQQEGGEAVSVSFLGRRLAALDQEADPLLPEARLVAQDLPEGGQPPPGYLQGGGDEKGALPSVQDEQRSAAKLQLAAGQQVKGEVLQTVGKHEFLIRVGGELFRMQSAAELKKGESVSLTFLGSEPMVLFELQPGDGAAEPVRLSALGRWLATAPEGEGPALAVRGALVHGPWEGTPLLAARLKEALTAGGLFYESHLAKWAAGALPLAELLKEPQGRLSRLRRAPGGASGAEAPEKGNGIADDRTLPLVREQLLLLNSGVLSYRGEAWTGQEMELTVRERGVDEEPGVEATLALELPHLGGVRAKLHLGDNGVVLELVTQRPESCAVLKTGAGDLMAAGSAAGVHLSRVSVRHEEEE